MIEVMEIDSDYTGNGDYYVTSNYSFPDNSKILILKANSPFINHTKYVYTNNKGVAWEFKSNSNIGYNIGILKTVVKLKREHCSFDIYDIAAVINL